ncbi:MAG: DUF4339 domain-containing protein [Hyphomonadaceae bacterium]
MDYSIDLGKVDPPVWRVMINGAVYGPYTLGQLQGFAQENRIRPRTKIAKGDGAPFQPAEEIKDLVPALKQAFQEKPERRKSDAESEHNYLISVSINSSSNEPFVRELNTMGFFVEIMPSTYLLRSQMPLKFLKQRFNDMLQATDSLFIADATNNRFASVNLSMESDIHLRDIWDKKLGAAAA